MYKIDRRVGGFVSYARTEPEHLVNFYILVNLTFRLFIFGQPYISKKINTMM